MSSPFHTCGMWGSAVNQAEHDQTEIATPPMPCPACKVGHLHLKMITDAQGRVVYRRPLPGHSVAYLD